MFFDEKRELRKRARGKKVVWEAIWSWVQASLCEVAFGRKKMRARLVLFIVLFIFCKQHINCRGSSKQKVHEAGYQERGSMSRSSEEQIKKAIQSCKRLTAHLLRSLLSRHLPKRVKNPNKKQIRKIHPKLWRADPPSWIKTEVTRWLEGGSSTETDPEWGIRC